MSLEMQQSKASAGHQSPAHSAGNLNAPLRAEANGRTYNGNGLASHPDQASAQTRGSTPSRSTQTLAGREITRATAPERYRFAFAIVISALYVGMLIPMFYLGIARPGAGITVRQVGTQWTVEGVMPPGLAYEQGIVKGDIILKVNGIEVEKLGDAGYGPPNFEGADTITIQRRDASKGQSPVTIDIQTNVSDNPITRWTYALLGLIFIGVGGPVFVKGRQRTAASAFYAFCISTAFAFATVIGLGSGNPWLLGMMFVSLVLFAGSFAFFFFNFPVRVGKSRRMQNVIIGGLIGTGAAVLIGYSWVVLIDAYAYEVIRPVVFLYLVACVLAGVITLIRGWVSEPSPEVRQQMLLLLGGTTVAVGPAVVLTVIPTMLFGDHILPIEISAVALGLMPLAFAYAITQHQLLGVRNFVRRSVVYLIMGSGVLLVFSVTAAAVSAKVPEGWERNEFGLIGFSFFVFLIAFSFSHLQKRVERLVDRYIYHDAYDYKEALLQFSSQLASEQKLHVLCDQLVERTCRLMNLSCGALLLAAHPEETNRRTDISRFRNVGLPTVFLDSSDLDPNEIERRTELLIPRDGTWPDDARSEQADEEQSDTIFLQIYARYGESAAELINGLQDELSHLGISLYRPEDSAVPPKLMWNNHVSAHESLESAFGRDTGILVEAGGVRRVTSLSDAVTGNEVTEVRRIDGYRRQGRNTGDLETIRSFLGVPLWTRSRFVGVLCLAGKRTGERFTKDDLSLLSTLGSQAALAVYNAQLHEAREQALLDTITALAHAIEAKDGYTIEHCEKMTGRAVALAQALDLPKQEIENIRLGAILHDVGKIGIPDAILNKPGKLTPEEYETIKEHAAIGARIVQSVGALHGVVPIVRHHQERYDGSGYPEGLAGEEIPIGARIIGVVDTYGAMTEDRIYRKAPGHARAIEELQRLAGRQFDPGIVEAFVHLLKEQPELAELELQQVS